MKNIRNICRATIPLAFTSHGCNVVALPVSYKNSKSCKCNYGSIPTRLGVIRTKPHDECKFYHGRLFFVYPSQIVSEPKTFQYAFFMTGKVVTTFLEAASQGSKTTADEDWEETIEFIMCVQQFGTYSVT